MNVFTLGQCASIALEKILLAAFMEHVCGVKKKKKASKMHLPIESNGKPAMRFWWCFWFTCPF